MTARVLVTGMGGELGTRVTNLLEADDSVLAIDGLDVDPPRRRMPQARFHLIDPADRDGIVDLVRRVDPTVIVHLGVYEPNARRSPAKAVAHTEAMSLAVLGAAARCPNLTGLVVRSGIEVYGRGRGSVICPDEAVTPVPTTAFGASLAAVEAMAAEAGRAAEVPVTVLRFAPVVGAHFPSPLGRYLRQPAVAISPLADLPFVLCHQEDAAAAALAAVHRGFAGPVNVVGPGATTPLSAVRMGGRLPVPTVGPGWLGARALAGMGGAPLPDHVRELLCRGRSASGAAAEQALGVAPAWSTPEVVRELYDWAEVVHLPAPDREAA